MFDLQDFIAQCLAAVRSEPTHRGVRELVARAVSDPTGVLKALGEPSKAELQTLHRSDELTVLNLVWGPRMTLPPHNHNMWAVIGIYTGREDNIFWRRLPGDARSRVEAAGAQALSAGDAVPLGRDVIHSVTNPIGRLTGALHVYGGDFFAARRSEWNPEDLSEGPLDVRNTIRLFEESNRLLARA